MDSECSIRVRKMYLEDIPAVASLEQEIFPDPWSAEAFEDSLEMGSAGGLVAELLESQGDTGRGALVGYACYYTAAGETHLTNIAVSPAYRRKKVARRLLTAIFDLARRAMSDAIFLEVRESNIAAQKLYRSYGFEELYRRKGYYSKPKEDAIVYIYEFSPAEEPEQQRDN